MNAPDQSEVQYLAALTVMSNESKALQAFDRNNKRAAMRGANLLSGINPFYLLSDKDKELLIAAQKMAEHARQQEALE